MAQIAAHLNAGVILVVTVYPLIISLESTYTARPGMRWTLNFRSHWRCACLYMYTYDLIPPVYIVQVHISVPNITALTRKHFLQQLKEKVELSTYLCWPL